MAALRRNEPLVLYIGTEPTHAYLALPLLHACVGQYDQNSRHVSADGSVYRPKDAFVVPNLAAPAAASGPLLLNLGVQISMSGPMGDARNLIRTLSDVVKI